MMNASDDSSSGTSSGPLIEGRDYTLESGLFVLTRDYLLRRGSCCRSGCRHCPYGYRKNDVSGTSSASSPSSSSPIDPQSDHSNQSGQSSECKTSEGDDSSGGRE